MRQPADADTLDASLDEAPTHSSFVAAADRIADRYEIVGLLGAGGMGNVYRVHDLELDEVVALKFLRRELLDSPGVLDRFRSEAKLARRVTHANVARTFDIGEHAGEKFLTMEFIDGPSLRAVLRREGRLAEARVIEVGLALCDALAAAHAAGVIHRDLKPDNVLIDVSGRIVVTDFGIACARSEGPQAAGRLVGTVAYMAPEQVMGSDELDGRVDIYALGVLLFELLAGQPPWRGDSAMAAAVARLHEPPPDVRSYQSTVSPALAAVVDRCLATRREHRYACVEDVAVALRAARDSEVEQPASAAGPPAPESSPQRIATSAGGLRTIAVLPFRNTSAAEHDYIADELTDDLIDALSSVDGLRVRPRRAVTQQLALTADLSTIGRELGVQVIVEGSVRRRDDMVRINARALSVVEGLQLWARRFERPANEILAINDEVARAVAEALCAELDAAPRAAPSSPEVVELYLRARQALRRGWAGFEGLREAVELFERALALAPQDVAVLSGYAMARARLLNYAAEGEHESSVALELASRAVAAAPGQGEPWLALATIYFTTSEWPAAARALSTALARAPGLQKAHEMLAAIELEVGCTDRALARLESVLAIDPQSWVARGALALAYALLGRDDAEALLSPAGPLPRPDVPEEAADFRVRHMALLRVQGYRGRLTLESASPHPQQRSLLVEVAGLWQLLSAAFEGRAVDPRVLDMCDAEIARTRVGSRFRPVLLQIRAELLGLIGDGPAVIDTLSQAVDAHLYDTLWLDHCPLLACARAEPRFAALRERVEARAALVRAALEEA